MIITTTSSIENATIESYLGIITTNVVVGTNIFSDLAASLIDIFGGNSGSYQGKLQGIYKTAIFDLTKQANKLGANAIVGLHIDFDEISGGGKSMFMVAVSGTAVKYENKVSTSNRYEMYEKLYQLQLFYKEGIITQEEYDYEKTKLRKDYDNIIYREVQMQKAREEAEAARLRFEEEKKQKEEEQNELLRKLQEEYKSKPLAFDALLIESADYSKYPINNIISMDEAMKIMIKIGAYNEACKYYIDETGLDVGDAISYVKYLYLSVIEELKSGDK